MLSGKKKKTAGWRGDGTVETLIGEGTRMTGTLQAAGTIRIEGEFEGDVQSGSDVIIGKEAKVRALVRGGNVVLAGRLEGQVEAMQLLEIHSSGFMMGDIKVGNLMVEDGAYFSGKCEMMDSEAEKRGAGEAGAAKNEKEKAAG